jgi:hypothetical protein
MNTNRYCERLAIPRPAVEHFIGRHDTSLLQLIVLALLEHGGPLSMEEIADRLLDAGVRAPSGDMVRSLHKAWHGLPPVIKEPDGTMGLDLESWELKHLAWELGRETIPAADAPPAPPAAEMPGDDVPLREVEVVTGSSPGWSDAWSRAGRWRVLAVDYGSTVLEGTGCDNRSPWTTARLCVWRLTPPSSRPLRRSGYDLSLVSQSRSARQRWRSAASRAKSVSSFSRTSV